MFNVEKIPIAFQKVGSVVLYTKVDQQRQR